MSTEASTPERWLALEGGLENLKSGLERVITNTAYVVRKENEFRKLLQEMASLTGYQRAGFFVQEEGLIAKIETDHIDLYAEKLAEPIQKELFDDERKAVQRELSHYQHADQLEGEISLALRERNTMLSFFDQVPNVTKEERFASETEIRRFRLVLEEISSLFSDYYQLLRDDIGRDRINVLNYHIPPNSLLRKLFNIGDVNRTQLDHRPGEVVILGLSHSADPKEIDFVRDLHLEHPVVIAAEYESSTKQGRETDAQILTRVGAKAYLLRPSVSWLAATIRTTVKNAFEQRDRRFHDDLAVLVTYNKHGVIGYLAEQHQRNHYGNAERVEGRVEVLKRRYPMVAKIGASDKDYLRNIYRGLCKWLEQGSGISDELIQKFVDRPPVGMESEALDSLRRGNPNDPRLAIPTQVARERVGEYIANELKKRVDEEQILPQRKEARARFGQDVFFSDITISPELELYTVDKIFEHQADFLLELGRLSFYRRQFPESDYNVIATEVESPSNGNGASKKYILTRLISATGKKNLLDQFRETRASDLDGPEKTRRIQDDLKMTIDRLVWTHASSPSYFATPVRSSIELTRKVDEDRFTTSLVREKILGEDEPSYRHAIRLGHLIVAKAFESSPTTVLNDAYLANFVRERIIYPGGLQINKIDEGRINEGPPQSDLATLLTLGRYVSDEPTIQLKQGLEGLCSLRIDNFHLYVQSSTGRKSLEELGYEMPTALEPDAKVSERELFYRRYFREYNKAILWLQTKSRDFSENTSIRRKKIIEYLKEIKTDTGESVFPNKKFAYTENLEKTMNSMAHIVFKTKDQVAIREAREIQRELTFLSVAYLSPGERKEVLDRRLLTIVMNEGLYLKRWWTNLNRFFGSGDLIEKREEDRPAFTSYEHFGRILKEYESQHLSEEDSEEHYALGELKRFVDSLYNQRIEQLDDFSSFIDLSYATDVHRALCHYELRERNIRGEEEKGPEKDEEKIRNYREEQRDIFHSALNGLDKFIEALGVNGKTKVKGEYLTDAELSYAAESGPGGEIPYSLSIYDALMQMHAGITEMQARHQREFPS
ncbi:hypothetical protein GOV09_06610 [Candidatus Woesearchaeota archaeon]|nr:hypothetical protein [Candidatus Woesearchaeota archaeon]